MVYRLLHTCKVYSETTLQTDFVANLVKKNFLLNTPLMYSSKLRSLAVIVFVITALQFCAQGQAITRLDKTTISFAALDHKIETLMKAANVQGLAVAVFNRNVPVYKKTFGYKRMDTKIPLTTSTNIYGASLSKPVFAVLVLKLVEEGVLDLDKPLQDYLTKPIFEYKSTKKWHDDYSHLKEDSLYKKNYRKDVPGSYQRFPQLEVGRSR